MRIAKTKAQDAAVAAADAASRPPILPYDFSAMIPTEVEVETRAQAQARNNTLQSLEMRANNIGTGGAKYLGDALRTHPSLTSLSLRNNRVGDEAVMLMARGIQQSRFFVPFFSSRGAGGVEDPEVARVRRAASGAASGYFDGDYGESDSRDRGVGVAAAAGDDDQDFLASCPLTDLDLSQNEIRDDGAVALASALCKVARKGRDRNRSERGRSDHHSEGKVRVAAAAATGNNDVAGGGVNWEEEEQEEETLDSPRSPPEARCVELVRLNLQGNMVRARGAKALGHMLGRCASLTHLNLSGNKLGFKFAGSENEPRQDYSKLQFNYSFEGAHALAKAIDVNATLTHLDLSLNHLCSVGGAALCESLQWSETLEALSLAGNEIGRSVQREEDERGDPRLDLRDQCPLRTRGAVSLAVPVRQAAPTTAESVATGALSVAGDRRSYHAGGEAFSQTRIHYETTRWPENTFPAQVRATKARLLPAGLEGPKPRADKPVPDWKK